MYQRVGTYDGRVPLQELADRLTLFDLAWAPSDYATTTDHFNAVREVYQPDLAAVLPGKWKQSMLVVIRPGGTIRFHTDIPVKGESLERYHVVLHTNDKCWNFHAGSWQQLDLGGIYTVDASKEHASWNGGEELRVHLVVDMEAARTGAPLDASVLV